MKNYIISFDKKYKVDKSRLVVNRRIACAKTTREGTTRADASDYIAPGLGENYYIGEGIDMSKVRIRKLSTRECWRLMGFAPFKEENGKLVFDDTLHDKAKQVNSDSQLYKQAGNSIVVDVLECIFKQMKED